MDDHYAAFNAIQKVCWNSFLIGQCAWCSLIHGTKSMPVAYRQHEHHYCVIVWGCFLVYFFRL